MASELLKTALSIDIDHNHVSIGSFRIASLSDGGLVGVWSTPTDAFDGIATQVVNADGSLRGSGSVIEKSGPNPDNVQMPTVAGLAGGGYAVAYVDRSGQIFEEQINSNYAGRVRVFDANSAQTGAQLLNPGADTTTFMVNVAASGAGYVAFHTEFSGHDAIRSTEGTVVAYPESAAHDLGRPSGATLVNGTRVVVWQDIISSTDRDVMARVGDGAEFRVSAASLGRQTLPFQSHAVAALSDGGFVIAWTEENDPVFGSDVRAQIFNANGSRRGAEFVVNSDRIDGQYDAEVVALANGRFAVAWTDSKGSAGVEFQVFESNGTKVGFENTVGGSFVPAAIAALGDQVAIGRSTAEGLLVETWRFVDAVHGGDAGETLDGSTGFEIIRGFGGDDILRGLGGGDILDGGDGIDRADYGAFTAAQPLYVNLRLGFALRTVGGGDADTLVAIENVDGGAGADVLVGSGEANHLRGFGGDDYLFGGDFAPDGSFLPDSGNDTLDGGAGKDGLFGADGSDHLLGGAGDDSLVGGAGDDTLEGGGDKDFLFGGEFTPAGAFAPNSGADILDGGAGDDALFGMDGDDTLRGGADRDILVGGAGADTLEGEAGDDFLCGGDFAPDGSLLPGSGKDTLRGDVGNDALFGFDDDDDLDGGGDDDYLDGGQGNDDLAGGAGNDTILGGEGSDAIAGGAGFDYLYGGGGADTFSFRLRDGYDSIWDFSAAEGDRLTLDPAFGLTFETFRSGLVGFTHDGADYSVLTLATADGETVFDQITIKGIAAADWTESLVIFA